MSLFPYYSSKHIIGVNLHLLIEDISQLLIKKKDKHQVSDLYIVLEEKLLWLFGWNKKQSHIW